MSIPLDDKLITGNVFRKRLSRQVRWFIMDASHLVIRNIDVESSAMQIINDLVVPTVFYLGLLVTGSRGT